MFGVVRRMVLILMFWVVVVLELNRKAVGYELHQVGHGQLIKITIDGEEVTNLLLLLLTFALLQ